jgi:hypothetical protein
LTRNAQKLASTAKGPSANINMIEYTEKSTDAVENGYQHRAMMGNRLSEPWVIDVAVLNPSPVWLTLAE